MKQKKTVNLYEICLILILSLCVITHTFLHDEYNDYVRFILIFFGITFLSLAFVAFLSWKEFNNAIVYEQVCKAESQSERVRLIIELQKLTSDQIKAFTEYIPAYEIISGTDGPIYLWRCIGNNLIDRSFIRDFISRGTDTNLYSVRNLDKENRELANALMTDFAARGWIEKPAGNQPAKWRNKCEAMLQLGLE